jgi:uncharacterized protein (DUF1499 family)
MALRRIALVLALLAVTLLVVSGPGTRMGAWHFRVGFQMLRWAAYSGLAAAALALIALLLPRTRALGVGVPAAALLLGLGAAFLPWRLMQGARAVPPIHDITTDLEDPPAFVAIAPLRAGASNPVEYAGPETADAQRRAYPDLRPLAVAAPPATAFARALDAARAMGWEIVAADTAAGRIEATATTRWYGFKDDVVVRVTPSDGGSRVDVRSKSRVGRGDVGANAARIRAYLARLGGAA